MFSASRFVIFPSLLQWRSAIPSFLGHSPGSRYLCSGMAFPNKMTASSERSVQRLTAGEMHSVDNKLVEALRDVVNMNSWQDVGTVDLLKSQKYTRFYCSDGEDIVVIYHDQKFYAMDANCSHEGGPLELGDIEDIDGTKCIVCPWHHYEFCLSTGESSTGLKQDTYEVQVVNGKVYVDSPSELSSVKPDCSKEAYVTQHVPPSVSHEDTLTSWAVKVLCTSDPEEKAKLTLEVADRWFNGQITDLGDCIPPRQPPRHSALTVVAPGKEKKRGKGGSLSSRISSLHSMANIEQWAVDLSWDVVARFANTMTSNGNPLPRQFFTDFIQIATEEAKHYTLCAQRLKELGSQFGALPVHNGLWESAEETSHDLLARLAIVHMVHEARGLDVQPQILSKFERNGDEGSTAVLKVIYEEEITHVAAGIRWFSYICEKCGIEPIPKFHELVKKHFHGYLKPPFNYNARTKAGMTEEWYMPLIKPK